MCVYAPIVVCCRTFSKAKLFVSLMVLRLTQIYIRTRQVSPGQPAKIAVATTTMPSNQNADMICRCSRMSESNDSFVAGMF